MSPDPRQIVRDFGVDPLAIRFVESLSDRHDHAVWRIGALERTYILKWLPERDASVEVKGYLLLQELGVPTPPLYGTTAQSLLMEDLARSDMFRLASPADLASPEVGRAVARWYREFHNAGEIFILSRGLPDFLTRETDKLTPDSIMTTSRALRLPSNHVWELAADHIELLKAAIDGLRVRLNYNDFYWTNLALSRRADSLLEAIVFDYHLLGVGMRYSDCRNVTGSLSGEAVRAFWESYGKVDTREKVLDQPLAVLYNLYTASRLSEFPKWAEDSRESVINGHLERDLIIAIELTRSLPV